MLTTFLRHLLRQLDREDPGWQQKTVILLDNASYHNNPLMIARLKRMGLRVMFSAPYAWAGAVCELAFAALKLGELNPEYQPTGKK